MTQYNTVNVKLSNAQLSKLKSRIRYGAEVTFDLSSKHLLMRLIFHIDYC